MEKTSKYWLDLAVADIIKHHPKGDLIVSSGVSPSGSYHIGGFREVLTADALAWGLRQAGRSAKHLHVVDNMDPLRKLYPFLSERFEEFVGRPYCLIPDPVGKCHDSYAKHYFEEFKQAAAKMGVEMEVVFSYEDQYQSGKMVPYIEQVLSQPNTVRTILEKVAGREVPKDWAPIQVLGKDYRFINASFDSWDKSAQTVAEVSYKTGQVKLNWRLDWPARWALHGVDVEPYGKEHATKGGSYDTGVEFVQQIFQAKPPYPVPYDTINRVGETKKMSSSLGNVVTPAQALEIMPAEILRYFILKPRPAKVVFFDSGLGLYNLIEEYSQIEQATRAKQDHTFSEAFQLAVAGTNEPVISSIPFSHLVAVYQAALGKFDQIIEILERTGYEEQAHREEPVLRREVEYIKNWLAKYAPDSVKFEVQTALPQVELSGAQQKFLADLAAKIEAEPNLSGQAVHDLIYASLEQAELRPQQAFQALYRVILGRDSGPKAGWFLASLEPDFLVKRLQLVA